MREGEGSKFNSMCFACVRLQPYNLFLPTYSLYGLCDKGGADEVDSRANEGA